jgi:hypothetical protein
VRRCPVCHWSPLYALSLAKWQEHLSDHTPAELAALIVDRHAYLALEVGSQT